MRGEGFDKLEETYLGAPLIIEKSKLKQHRVHIDVKTNKMIQAGKKSKI